MPGPLNNGGSPESVAPVNRRIDRPNTKKTRLQNKLDAKKEARSKNSDTPDEQPEQFYDANQD